MQLSFIVRLVPSPDWFVGVDGLNLCDGDQWKDNISLDLYPYDAGTDSGFTFSSPKYETVPQDKILQVLPNPNVTALIININNKHICFVLHRLDHVILPQPPGQLLLLPPAEASAPHRQADAQQDQ